MAQALASNVRPGTLFFRIDGCARGTRPLPRLSTLQHLGAPFLLIAAVAVCCYAVSPHPQIDVGGILLELDAASGLSVGRVMQSASAAPVLASGKSEVTIKDVDIVIRVEVLPSPSASFFVP